MSEQAEICAAFPAYFEAQKWPNIELQRIQYDTDKHAYKIDVYTGEQGNHPFELFFTLYRRDSGQHLAYEREQTKLYGSAKGSQVGFVLDIFEEFLETRDRKKVQIDTTDSIISTILSLYFLVLFLYVCVNIAITAYDYREISGRGVMESLICICAQFTDSMTYVPYMLATENATLRSFIQQAETLKRCSAHVPLRMLLEYTIKGAL